MKLKSLKDYIIKKKNSFFGNKNYTKFIVISRSRTGSNLLISLLNSHPDIVAKGEMFSNLNGENSKTIWNDIFDKMPNKIKRVGFKIFYYHPQDSDSKEVWDFIKNDDSINIIHLTRGNMLKTVVSRQIAVKTNKWSQYNNRVIPVEEKRIVLDIDYCLNEFESTKEFEKNIKKEYEREKFKELTYEDLIEDNQEVMNQIFNFLEVRNVKVLSSHKKQNKEKLEDLIINYKELVAVLKHSKWYYLIEMD